MTSKFIEKMYIILQQEIISLIDKLLLNVYFITKYHLTGDINPMNLHVYNLSNLC